MNDGFILLNLECNFHFLLATLLFFFRDWLRGTFTFISMLSIQYNEFAETALALMHKYIHIYYPEKVLRGHSTGRIQCTINQSFKKLVTSGVHVKGKMVTGTVEGNAR